MAPAWVATAGPDGWVLGRWVKVSDTVWEERKWGGLCQKYDVLTEPSRTPGSTTVRLKMFGIGTTEVLILDTTVQVFTSGQYMGEYLGHWEGATTPAPGNQSAILKPPTQGTASGPVPDAVGVGPSGSSGIVVPRGLKAANLDRSPEMVAKLLLAIDSGDLRQVKALLAANVDPDAHGINGRTPLVAAASNGSLPVVEALLAAGADVNLPSKDGATPLTTAFQNGHKDVLRLLFAATFNSLDTTVGKNVGKGDTLQVYTADDELPDGAIDSLREVTTRLAQVSEPGQRMLTPNGTQENALRNG